MGRSSAAQLAKLEERLGPHGSRSFDERTTAELVDVFERELTAVEGISTLLDRLDAAGGRAGVGARGTHQRVRHNLGPTRLFHRFARRVFSAPEGAPRQPPPGPFL